MSLIREYCIKNANEWDSIVKSFPNYEVFYLSDYVKAFMNEDKKNGEPILILFENDEDRAINVLFRRDVACDEKLKGSVNENEFYDLITPYGYGGFIGNVSNWNELNKSYTHYCIDKKYICEFVRFNLFSDYYKYYDGETETRTHNVVRSLDMPIEKIWMDFKPKVRKNVKRAKSSGLEIIVESNGDYIEDFLRIYYGTMDRTDAESEFYFSRDFFENLNKMNDNIMYFHAVYDGKIISTELVIYGAENSYSYLGGTDRDYFNLRPNDFLKYEIIKWTKENGLKNFVLGGCYGKDDGIFNYKQSFAPDGVMDFYIGRKIFNQESYDLLVNYREGSSLNEKFFPLYRS